VGTSPLVCNRVVENFLEKFHVENTYTSLVSKNVEACSSLPKRNNSPAPFAVAVSV
jgi:hypothetical protein